MTYVTKFAEHWNIFHFGKIALCLQFWQSPECFPLPVHHSPPLSPHLRVPPSCPWPRTHRQLPSAIRPCPRNTAIGLVQLPTALPCLITDPIKPEPPVGLWSVPTLRRCLMLGLSLVLPVWPAPARHGCQGSILTIFTLKLSSFVYGLSWDVIQQWTTTHSFGIFHLIQEMTPKRVILWVHLCSCRIVSQSGSAIKM